MKMGTESLKVATPEQMSQKETLSYDEKITQSSKSVSEMFQAAWGEKRPLISMNPTITPPSERL